MNRPQAETLGEISRDNRIRGAVWGQFLGDAFCLGSHWIYSLAELEQRFPGGPQGFETPAAGHYHAGKQAGELTHYGDGALLLLQSLADKGSFDAIDFGSRFVDLFASPGYRGYRDHATKETIARFQEYRALHPKAKFAFQDGADDDQPATVSRLAPLAALHCRDDAYLSVVEQATLVCQNNRRAVAYAQAHALILRELFSGGMFEHAVGAAAAFMTSRGDAGSEVSARINAAVAARHLDVREATRHFGQGCPLAASFPAAIQCTLRHSGDIAGALRATAAAGGDSAGRGAMIGAWLGGTLGVGALPPGWREGLTAQATIAACLERIVAVAGEAG